MASHRPVENLTSAWSAPGTVDKQMPRDTILIIDDSTELRALLESILPYSGYQAISATTGKEGLKLALEFNPDVILVDLELPDTTGLQLLEAFNQHELTMPTIMMTGYGSEGVAARALRLGALDYLVKPFTTEEVLSSVERALTVERLRRENAQLTAMLDVHARHFRMLQAIGRAALEDRDLDKFFQRIVEAGLYATRAEACLLLLLDTAQDQLCIAAVHGQDRQVGNCFPRQSGDQRLWAVLESGASVRLHTSADRYIKVQGGDGVKAVLQVPLIGDEQMLGLLSAERQSSGSPYGKHDEQILAILADYAVMALEKHRPVEASTTASDSPPGKPESAD